MNLRTLARTGALAASAMLVATLALSGARADDDGAKEKKPEDKKVEKVSLKPGDAAPDFKVKNHEGKEVKLADLKNKRFLLWFFPKADTPG